MPYNQRTSFNQSFWLIQCPFKCNSKTSSSKLIVRFCRESPCVTILDCNRCPVVHSDRGRPSATHPDSGRTAGVTVMCAGDLSRTQSMAGHGDRVTCPTAVWYSDTQLFGGKNRTKELVLLFHLKNMIFQPKTRISNPRRLHLVLFSTPVALFCSCVNPESISQDCNEIRLIRLVAIWI